MTTSRYPFSFLQSTRWRMPPSFVWSYIRSLIQLQRLLILLPSRSISVLYDRLSAILLVSGSHARIYSIFRCHAATAHIACEPPLCTSESGKTNIESVNIEIFVRSRALKRACFLIPPRTASTVPIVNSLVHHLFLHCLTRSLGKQQQIHSGALRIRKRYTRKTSYACKYLNKTAIMAHIRHRS